MTNLQFAEYATSGTFIVKLSRQQIAALGILIAKGGRMFGGPEHPLARKGLIEPVPEMSALVGGEPQIEYRATAAGLLAYALCIEAGLTNGPRDPVVSEMEAQRAKMVEAIETANRCRSSAQSMAARLASSEIERVNLERRVAVLEARLRGEAPEGDIRPLVRITPRDPRPDLSVDEIMRVFDGLESGGGFPVEGTRPDAVDG